jgi:putative PIN family toxin of toxin-antitoxin system
VTSLRLSDELQRVLQREKFRRYLPLEAVPTFIRRIRMIVPFSEEGPVRPATEDPKDDYLIALALSNGADVLVSGDPHLLDANEAVGGAGRGVRVLTPREFLEELG